MVPRQHNAHPINSIGASAEKSGGRVELPAERQEKLEVLWLFAAGRTACARRRANRMALA
jgi:hypothetical protein